jgi:hypothetical protein
MTNKKFTLPQSLYPKGRKELHPHPSSPLKGEGISMAGGKEGNDAEEMERRRN